MKKYENIIEKIKIELPKNNWEFIATASRSTSSKYIEIYDEDNFQIYTIRFSNHGRPYTLNNFGRKTTVVPTFEEISYGCEVEDLDVNLPSMVFKTKDLDFKYIASQIIEDIGYKIK